MKLANWNLDRAKTPARQTALLEQTDKIVVDVWVFTETHTDFSPGPQYEPCHSIAGRDGTKIDKDSDCWVSIWSKHALERLQTTDQKRTVAARISPEGAAPFLVYGTILPWVGSKWRRKSWAHGIIFREALEEQVSEWMALRRKYPDDELFVLGDFNQDLALSHYYGTRENYGALKDALDVCGLVALTGGDDDPIHRGSAPWACIDHICMLRDSHWRSEPAIRWPNAREPDKRLSDHFGVAVTLVRR